MPHVKRAARLVVGLVLLWSAFGLTLVGYLKYLREQELARPSSPGGVIGVAAKTAVLTGLEPAAFWGCAPPERVRWGFRSVARFDGVADCRLTTVRLELRPLPAKAAAALPQDREYVSHFLGVALSPDWPLRDLLDVLPIQASAPPIGERFGVWVVIERESATVVGDIGFFGPPDAAGVLEVGYSIVPRQLPPWSRGRSISGASRRSSQLATQTTRHHFSPSTASDSAGQAKPKVVSTGSTAQS